MRDQSSHNNDSNDERRPNNKFNVNPTITGRSNVATFLQPERSLEDDIDKSDQRQKYSDFAVNSDQPPAERVNENLDDYLEPELGLQFPLGDPIVGSAVQDLDISLVSPTTEPSYLLKTTQPTQPYYPPIQTTNLLKTTSFEPNFPPRTTNPSKHSQPQQQPQKARAGPHPDDFGKSLLRRTKLMMEKEAHSLVWLAAQNAWTVFQHQCQWQIPG